MRDRLRSVLCALLVLSLGLWSALPASTHAPTIFETIHEHLEIAAGHGHTHGLEEDLAWALHGHDHDAADHDHSQAILALPHGAGRPVSVSSLGWRPAARNGPGRAFRIERPPRA